MEFTGERFVPTQDGRIRLEHYHRYAILQNAVKGKRVLDVACGEGYGSALVAASAQSVVGVDISQDAVEHARVTYVAPNLCFRQGSATALEFPDASFDVVISFETIEHLGEQAEMLAEIRRVLHSDGILIISSPNRPVYSEESGEHNDFHVKELDFQELNALLESQFGTIAYFGQRLMMGSVIQSMGEVQGAYRAFYDDGTTVFPGTGDLVDPVYFVAVCARAGIDLPRLDASVLYPAKVDLVKHYVGFAKWAQSLDKLVADQNFRILSAQQEIDNLSDELARRGEWAQRLEDERARLLTNRIARIFTMLREDQLWRKAPARQVERLLKSCLRVSKIQGKRGIKAALNLAKRSYQRLPLSENTKAVHRKHIARTLPRLLHLSGSPPATVPDFDIPGSDLSRRIVREPAKLVQENLSRVAALETMVSTEPEVSIIIPVYGKYEYTLHCLASIAEHPPQTPFEIIVIDDCSPDASGEKLAEIKGIRVLLNEMNQGFIRSCNIGANNARSSFLHFLNNDTEVTEGWLDELLRTFEDFPGTGFAGSKLVYPDGTLQEAGGIIWRDGNAWNFGRNQKSTLPVYNYAREVDYCSGASVLVPKSLFEELGGFDEHYIPAYCEDADLALKIRDRGYRVIYQPLSVVIHYEGVTSGRDETQGVKSYQIVNMQKMFTRWEERLKNHQMTGQDIDRAKDRMASRRVLVLDHCTPTPNQDAGSVLAFNTFLLFREMGFQVTFIAEDNFLYVPGHTEALQRIGVEVLYWPFVQTVEQHLRECGNRYDLVYLVRPKVVDRNLDLVRKHCPQAKVLFNTVDLHFIRMEREAALVGDPSKAYAAQQMQALEFSAIKAVDATIVVSSTELDLLRPRFPDSRIHLFPLIMDVPGTKIGFTARRDILFVGGYQHTPNVDAVHYFVTEVMPYLRSRLPGVRFFAVGSNPPPDIIALKSDDVVITGFVENLPSLLDKMRVSVAPLRYGAGIKGKISTALAHGLPVVATSMAIEGMSLIPGEHLLVADDAEAFAEAIAQLYEDETRWGNLSSAGQDVALREWGVESAWTSLSMILNDIGFATSRSKRPLSTYSDQSGVLREPKWTSGIPAGQEKSDVNDSTS